MPMMPICSKLFEYTDVRRERCYAHHVGGIQRHMVYLGAIHMSCPKHGLSGFSSCEGMTLLTFRNLARNT